jgi:hypothetical protein
MAGLATRERVPVEAEARSSIAAALARGPLALGRIEAPLAVLDGQLRAGPGGDHGRVRAPERHPRSGGG